VSRINTNKTGKSVSRIEDDVRELKSTLAALLRRLENEAELRKEADVIMLNQEATLQRIALDACSVLSAVNSIPEPSVSLDVDGVVSSLGSRSTYETAAIIPLARCGRLPDSEATPHLEYTGSYFHVSLNFLGPQERVAARRRIFRAKALQLATTSLRQLCQEVLDTLGKDASTGARLDFFWYNETYDLRQVKDFLADEVNFVVPQAYCAGDTYVQSPSWYYTLTSRVEIKEGPWTKFVPSHKDSNRWRLLLLRPQRIGFDPSAEGDLRQALSGCRTTHLPSYFEQENEIFDTSLIEIFNTSLIKDDDF
jgi:hypothetical protein